MRAVDTMELVLNEERSDGDGWKVAAEIQRQLGGWNRIKTMTGAKNDSVLVHPANTDETKGPIHDGGVEFRFPNPLRSRGNRVKILLMPSDTYDVWFYNGDKEIKHLDDIYADSLIEVFEQQTGLSLTMSKVIVKKG